MTPDEIRKAREELDREYDRLLPDAVWAFVISLCALLGIFFVLSLVGVFH